MLLDAGGGGYLRLKASARQTLGMQSLWPGSDIRYAPLTLSFPLIFFQLLLLGLLFLALWQYPWGF
jgi:hypothetical protein